MSRRERQRRRRGHRGSAARPAFLALALVFSAVVIGGLSVVGWVVQVAASAPDYRSLKQKDPGETSVVYAQDGTRIGFIQADILRVPIKADDMPTAIKNATVAVEDRRFYQHRGVDAEGVVRAALKNIESGETVEGGSTLTMQLVKNLYLADRTRAGVDGFKRKVREAKIAEEMESAHPGIEGKRWILWRYLNSVPYGNVGGQDVIGVQAAARAYFDKPAKDLEVHEAALLAGLPQAPSLYDPFDQPERAKRRRDDVLDNMVQARYLKASTAAQAKQRPLGVERSRFYTYRREGYFFDYVKSELFKRYGVERVRKGGLRVYTTIDFKKQQQARAAIAGKLPSVPTNPSSAIVTIDPSNGHILAMASSARYGDSKFNLAAQGKRQPGSTFKTMALMEALRRGVDPDRTTYVSKRLKFNDPQWGPIDVSTYSDSYAGRMNLTKATTTSDNSVYMQLALDLGPKAVERTAHRMGIRSPLEGLPSESLGGLKVGVSPLEMANAYATIEAGGVRRRATAITKVVFPDGRVRRLGRPKAKRVFTDGVAAKAREILVKNVQGGTGGSAATSCPTAGKTGTTDEFVDAWFVGFTPKLTTAVWIGHPRTRITMPGVAGGTFPAQIWGDYMRQAVRGSSCGQWSKPKTPFQAAPFFGRYATTGGGRGTPADGSPASGAPGSRLNDGIASNDGAAQAAIDQETGGAGNDGGGGERRSQRYPSDLYETPPQRAPDTGGD